MWQNITVIFMRVQISMSNKTECSVIKSMSRVIGDGAESWATRGAVPSLSASGRRRIMGDIKRGMMILRVIGYVPPT